MTNSENIAKGIDSVIKELTKIQRAIRNKNARQIEQLLAQAARKRADLIKYKVRKKELL